MVIEKLRGVYFLTEHIYCSWKFFEIYDLWFDLQLYLPVPKVCTNISSYSWKQAHLWTDVTSNVESQFSHYDYN